MFRWIQTLFKPANSIPQPASEAARSPEAAPASEASPLPAESPAPVAAANREVKPQDPPQEPIEPIQPLSPEGLEEAIRLEAYYLWEADGKPEGNGDYYWQKAAALIKQTRGNSL